MTPSEVYNFSHNSNYFYVHFYDKNVLERLGKSKMNTVCMKDGSCLEIKLFIPIKVENNGYLITYIIFILSAVNT